MCSESLIESRLLILVYTVESGHNVVDCQGLSLSLSLNPESPDRGSLDKAKPSTTLLGSTGSSPTAGRFCSVTVLVHESRRRGHVASSVERCG